MAMLKHEETFREQVYELHRLYQIQKLLMKNISSIQKSRQEYDRQNIKIVTKSNQTNYHQPQKFALAEGDERAKIDDESDLELTLSLGPTSNCRRRRKSIETSFLSESTASFSSSSTGSSNIKRKNTIQEELNGWKWGLEMPGSSNSSVVGSRKNSSDIQEQLRQDRISNPPLLLQALSLNTS